MDKAILQVIADNPALLNAVKQIIIDKFEELVVNDVGLDDVKLGQMLRARLVGIKIVEEAFRDILQYKSSPQIKERVNEAR